METENTSAELESLLAYVSSEGRVCPMPIFWDRLWQMLPGRQRMGGGWKPPVPLILAAWKCAPAGAKRERLMCHIRYANDKGVLKEVGDFLRGLRPEDWLVDSGK